MVPVNSSRIADNCQQGIRIAPDASHPGRLTLDNTTITGSNVALTVALMSDRGVRRLNHDFRGKDKPTNVLSFPADRVPGRRVELGDVALALGVVRREAREQGKTAADHWPNHELPG